MPPLHLHIALTLHLLIEFPASLSFLLQPRAQLPGATPEAVLVLRNLGGLLMATNLVCLVLLHFLSKAATSDSSPLVEHLTGMVCVALGTYHVWPAHRAWVRMRKRNRGEGVVGQSEKRILGGPVVHFWVHLVCLGAMMGSGGAVLMREREV
ncbi:hypothetical protein VTJ49DRAFT_6465 [Mycothermus thermophilus]|uniref:Uncharacterized protein n=1 Tax=Humicola insolens TaxID=85995 RepID=A0ABR3VJE2_HUMIN